LRKQLLERENGFLSMTVGNDLLIDVTVDVTNERFESQVQCLAQRLSAKLPLDSTLTGTS
jgi:hypothetical protein